MIWNRACTLKFDFLNILLCFILQLNIGRERWVEYASNQPDSGDITPDW